MNSSQPTDQQISTSVKSVPIVWGVEALKQVTGGSTKLGDPVWVTASDGQPQIVHIPDPAW